MKFSAEMQISKEVLKGENLNFGIFLDQLSKEILAEMKKENIFDSVVHDEILENNIYRLRISTHCMGNAQYSELKRKADAYDQIMNIKDRWNIK